jgi:hypothetical protein
MVPGRTVGDVGVLLRHGGRAAVVRRLVVGADGGGDGWTIVPAATPSEEDQGEDKDAEHGGATNCDASDGAS